MAHAAPSVSTPTRGRPPIVGLRDTILRAAGEIFARHDYHEVLMDDVARSCGVGKGTLYRYFPGKRELYVAVMFEGIERVRAELQTTVDTAGPPVLAIERIVRCILAYFWDRQYFFALIHRNEHKPDDPDTREWLRRRTELSRVVERAVRKAIAAGHVRDVDPRIAAEMLLGMLRGANRYRTSHDGLEHLVTVVVEMFLGGVGTRTGQRLAADRCARR
ncbi:MAG TPA: TetR/AcrR family transcriptional regulator [Candidatus Binatia bacterium]|nr:TetR/AcrR family transcriptional regulator [Candidatus Binatia bacterium]